MFDFEDDYWASVRATRASRPRLATSGARAKTFSAALEQAEQLWRAAKNVGPQSSPMLLFYGVAQAGRALCAAGFDGPDWISRSSHGLHFSCERLGSESKIVSLDQIQVRSDGWGLVQQVAQVLRTPVLGATLGLDEILANLYSKLTFSDAQLDKPKPIQVGVYESWSADSQPARAVLEISPVPSRFTSRVFIAEDGTSRPGSCRSVTVEELTEWLSPYPKLAVLGPPAEAAIPTAISLARGEWEVIVRWNNHAELEGLNQSEWTRKMVDSEYANTDFRSGTVLPLINGNDKVQDQYITWWLVLYSLSMLARYYPREWSALLDVDQSELAVPLEHLLTTAIADVPFYISSRISGLDELNKDVDAN